MTSTERTESLKQKTVTLEELGELIAFLKNVQEEHGRVAQETNMCHSHFRDWSEGWNKGESDFIVVTRF